MSHFSRRYCPTCHADTLFHGRKCAVPKCGYEVPNGPEKRTAWDDEQKRRIKHVRGKR
jgi:hypothetical protein